MNSTLTLSIAKMFDHTSIFPNTRNQEGKESRVGKGELEKITTASSNSCQSRRGSQYFCLESFKSIYMCEPHLKPVVHLWGWSPGIRCYATENQLSGSLSGAKASISTQTAGIYLAYYPVSRNRGSTPSTFLKRGECTFPRYEQAFHTYEHLA